MGRELLASDVARRAGGAAGHQRDLRRHRLHAKGEPRGHAAVTRARRLDCSRMRALGDSRRDRPRAILRDRARGVSGTAEVVRVPVSAPGLVERGARCTGHGGAAEASAVDHLRGQRAWSAGGRGLGGPENFRAVAKTWPAHWAARSPRRGPSWTPAGTPTRRRSARPARRSRRASTSPAASRARSSTRSGWRGAETIVAINKEARTRRFSTSADLGVVGDRTPGAAAPDRARLRTAQHNESWLDRGIFGHPLGGSCKTHISYHFHAEFRYYPHRIL